MAKLQKIWILFVIGLVLTYSAAKAEDTSDPDYPDDEVEDEDDNEETSNLHVSITTEPKILEVEPGQRVELQCRGENLGQQVAVIWSKGSIILAAGEVVVVDDKRLTLSSTDLIIDDVTAKDAGEYTCKTTTQRAAEVTHTLRVFEQPRASVSTATRVAKDGDSVTLSCDVTGFPEPIVTWERKGKKMPSGETNTQGSELTFYRVSRHHAGVYECVAKNKLGAARTAVSLVVTHAPEIDVERESVNSGKGYDAELVCIVHAEPKAHVVWYKDGRPVDISRHVTEEKQKHYWILHLKDVQESDFGNYTCVANNTFGRSNKSIYLTGAPSQPMLKEEYLGKDHLSYTVVWSLESAVAAEEFKIKFRKYDEDWQEIPVKGEKVHGHVYTVSYTFRDLMSSSDYEVTLAASNQFGWSLEARPKKFHINGDYRSLEAESEPGAKEAIGTGAVGSLRPISSFLSQISYAFIVSAVILRWQL